MINNGRRCYVKKIKKCIENVKCDSVCAVLSLWLREEPRIVGDR